MPIKTIVIETPDGARKTIRIEVPEEPKSADQQIRERRAPGFDAQTPAQAALAGLQEGAVEGAKGFAKEIVPGTVKAVQGIPGAIYDTVRMAISAGGEGADLLTDPVGTLTRWRDAAGELPGKAKQALDDTIAMAANDPQKFGAAVADLTAETGVGFATAKAIPTAGKPVARRVGPAMASLGEKARFPLRISGGAAIASGNLPVGAALMATPEVLESGGKALTRWGNTGRVPTRLVTPGGTVVASKTAPAQMTVASEVVPTKAALPRFVTDVEKGLVGNIDDITDPARAGLEAVDEAIDAEKKRSGAIRIASGKREAAVRRAEEAADLSEVRKPVGLTPQEQELLNRATSVTPAGPGNVRITPPAPRAASTLEEIGDEVDLTGVSGGAPNVSRERAAERFGRNFVNEGVTTPEGRRLPQELLDVAEDVPELPPAGADLDIPSTRSRRSPLSAVDDRLTENDFDALRQIIAENPGISTSEASRFLLDERAARSQMYRNRAGLDRGAQTAFDLDE